MGERKVLNKYYPPDFDPSKLPRGKKPKNQQITVRVMVPMTVACETCGEYIYKGKKFNSRKETVKGEDYLGIKIFRFYIKCPRCSAEMTFKTDPKNSDYTAEFGMKRNFEPFRPNELNDMKKKEREEEEEQDSMKALENRTIDSKQEMDILDALDELRALNARHVSVDTEELLKKRMEEFDQKEAKLMEEEEQQLRQAAFTNPASFVRRISKEKKSEGESVWKINMDNSAKVSLLCKRTGPASDDKKSKRRKLLGVKVIKAAEEEDETTCAVSEAKPGALALAAYDSDDSDAGDQQAQAAGGAALSVLGDYGSDSD